jgi:trehalose 6-phosphate phosphatase
MARIVELSTGVLRCNRVIIMPEIRTRPNPAQFDASSADARPADANAADAYPDRKAPPVDGAKAQLPPQAPRFDLDRATIFLDVDGTLLDLAPTPLEVSVPARLRNALAALKVRLGGALAFISGRPIAEIDRIFHPLRLPAVGGHGAEIRFARDTEIQRSRIATLDNDLRHEFAQIVQLDPGILVEDKGFSIAIHYRLSPQFGGEVMKHVATICRHERCASLEVLPGKLVVEIKPSGYDKGTGLRELMSVSPFSSRKPVFIGDDITDQAAFAVLPDFDGIGFSVGGAVPGATFNFDGPQDVRLWLERLGLEQFGLERLGDIAEGA